LIASGCTHKRGVLAHEIKIERGEHEILTSSRSDIDGMDEAETSSNGLGQRLVTVRLELSLTMGWRRRACEGGEAVRDKRLGHAARWRSTFIGTWGGALGVRGTDAERATAAGHAVKRRDREMWPLA
jgi:hypothetical protein